MGLFEQITVKTNRPGWMLDEAIGLRPSPFGHIPLESRTSVESFVEKVRAANGGRFTNVSEEKVAERKARFEALKETKKPVKETKPRPPVDENNPGPYPWRGWMMRREGTPGAWRYNFGAGFHATVKDAFEAARKAKNLTVRT